MISIRTPNRPVGLRNLGNTCYINADLQWLVNCREFIKDLCLRRQNHKCTVVQCLFIDLAYKLSQGLSAQEDISKFVKAILQKHPSLSAGHGDDPSYFFDILLEELEVNNICTDIVNQNFKLQIMTEYKCGCSKMKDLEESYKISIISCKDIKSGLREYMYKKEGYCKRCKCDRVTVRSTLSTPRYLVFTFVENHLLSHSKRIVFGGDDYWLCSVVYGSNWEGYGHARSAIKKEKWYECNDSYVTAINGEPAARNAYMVIYKKNNSVKLALTCLAKCEEFVTELMNKGSVFAKLMTNLDELMNEKQEQILEDLAKECENASTKEGYAEVFICIEHFIKLLKKEHGATIAEKYFKIIGAENIRECFYTNEKECLYRVANPFTKGENLEAVYEKRKEKFCCHPHVFTKEFVNAPKYLIVRVLPGVNYPKELKFKENCYILLDDKEEDFSTKPLDEEYNKGILIYKGKNAMVSAESKGFCKLIPGKEDAVSIYKKDNPEEKKMIAEKVPEVQSLVVNNAVGNHNVNVIPFEGKSKRNQHFIKKEGMCAKGKGQLPPIIKSSDGPQKSLVKLLSKLN